MPAADALRRHLRSVTSSGPQQTSMRAFVTTSAAPTTKRARLSEPDIDSITERMTLRALHGQQQRASDAAGVTVCSLTQLDMRGDKCVYYGCATCGRKVDAGTSRCPGTGCADPTGQATLRLNCSFADSTGALDRVTVFGRSAEALLERTAIDVQRCTEDEARYFARLRACRGTNGAGFDSCWRSMRRRCGGASNSCGASLAARWICCACGQWTGSARLHVCETQLRANKSRIVVLACGRVAPVHREAQHSIRSVGIVWCACRVPCSPVSRQCVCALYNGHDGCVRASLHGRLRQQNG